MDELIVKLVSKQLTVKELNDLTQANLEYVKAINHILKDVELRGIVEVTSTDDYIYAMNPKIVGEELQVVYIRYVTWCNECNINPMSKLGFSKIIYNKMGVKSKVVSQNGKSVRKYVTK